MLRPEPGGALVAADFRLYLITDDAGRTADELAALVARGIAGGVTAVQFREKSRRGADLLAAYEAVAAACRAGAARLILNADVVPHLPAEATPPAAVHHNHRTWPADGVAGYSAHSVEECAAAYRQGAAFCTLSPIFETPSKAGLLEPTGVDVLAQVRALCPQGILVALGGIDSTNAAHCVRAGADGVAVMRAVLAADDAERAAEKLRAIVEKSLAL